MGSNIQQHINHLAIYKYHLPFQPRSLVLPLLGSPFLPACDLQIRGDAKAAKARIAESEKRIDSELEAFISKAYW